LFGYFQRIIHFNAQISNRAFELGVPEQKLYGPEILGSSVNQRCLVLRNEWDSGWTGGLSRQNLYRGFRAQPRYRT
jgi:hypothetical protein